MFQGSFETFEFPEVLAMLSHKRQSGRLRVHSASTVVDVHLVEGRLSHAEVSRHGSAVQVADSRSRLEEACFEVLRWEHGSFEFHPGPPPPGDRGLDAPVDDVLDGARQRLAQWHDVEQILPTLDGQPRLVRDVKQAEVVLDRGAWRVVSAVDGRRNARTLARLLGMSTYELGSVLSGLVAAGLVEIDTPRARAAIAPPVPPRASTMASVHVAGDAPPPPEPGRQTGATGEAGDAGAPAAAAAQEPAEPSSPKAPALLRIVSRRIAPQGG